MRSAAGHISATLGTLGAVLLVCLAAGSMSFLEFQRGFKPTASTAPNAEGKGASGYPARVSFYPVRIALRGTKPVQFELPLTSNGQFHQLSTSTEAAESSMGVEETLLEPAKTWAEAGNNDGGTTLPAVRLFEGRPLAGGGSHQFIRLNYNLAAGSGNPDVIDVQKVFRANGVDKGRLGLRILNDTTILVRSSDLISLIGDDLGREAIAALDASKLANGYTDFDTLRAAGIDLRYDPTHDKVSVITGTSRGDF